MREFKSNFTVRRKPVQNGWRRVFVVDPSVEVAVGEAQDGIDVDKEVVLKEVFSFFRL